LAIAAYNAGQGRIDSAIVEGKTRDFFLLVARGLIAKQTSDFVAKFIATTMLTRNLDVYGFDKQAEIAPGQGSGPK
jgi:membrane-bound lytic murein transglycosylase D